MQSDIQSHSLSTAAFKPALKPQRLNQTLWAACMAFAVGLVDTANQWGWHVNVSPVQFRRDDIEREVANALASSQLSASCIELELTESLLLADTEHLSGVLKRLRNTGVQFFVDDFGTGYSNLGYLSRFDVQRLKIDQSFLPRMLTNPGDEGIVRAIIAMAHCLKLQVAAEGIEDAPTLERLTALGCEFGQGYHWSPALPAQQVMQFCQRHRGA